MAHSIESRSPFMDYRIVDFALGLPDNMKIRYKNENVNLKYILKQAFKHDLPKEIYLRDDKIGFSSNINDKLRGELNYIVENAKSILNKYLPDIIFFENLKFFHQYVRWEYQVVQLAITYLLYCRKFSPNDVKLIISRGYI
jgi:asparagine synthetase B (glutamine-hydrolysing)